MREVIATGKTVEEATENGCRELGLNRDEVSVEILEYPMKKLFKSTPAQVKVTADGEDETPAPEQKKEEKPAPQKKAEPAAAPEKQGGSLLPVEEEVKINLDEDKRAAMAVDYLKTILDAMGAHAEINAYKQGDATLLRVDGGNVEDKMKISGDTIQALSYLIDRSVNSGVDKKEDGYLRVRLDIGGYRSRRESELIALANRTGKEVARTGRSRTLEPMNPYERLIIHTAISQIDGIISESVGTDVERRVVIKSTAPNATDGEDWRPNNRRGGGGGNRGGGRGGNNNRGGGNRGRNDNRRGGGGSYKRETSTPEREYADKERDTSTAPIVPQKRDAIDDGANLPLYGKIDI